MTHRNLLYAAACAAALTAAPAHAVVVGAGTTFGFGNIPTNDPGEKAIENAGTIGSFALEVIDNTTGVLVQVKNLLEKTSSIFIGNIFFDDANGLLTAPPGGHDASFSQGVIGYEFKNNGNLPQGNAVSFNDSFMFKRLGNGGPAPAALTTKDTGNGKNKKKTSAGPPSAPPPPVSLGSSTTGNGNENGVQGGEIAGFVFGSSDYNSVVTGLQNNSLRVGLHIQGIGTNDASDAIVSLPNDSAPPDVIPLPAAVWMLGAGLGSLGLLGRRRRARA